MRVEKFTKGPWSVTGISMATGNVSVGQRDLRIVIAEVTNAPSLGDMVAGAMRRGGGQFDPGDCSSQHANAPLMLEALQLAAGFIRNGTELGYVRVPDDASDAAGGTLPSIEFAISAALGAFGDV